MPKNRVAIGDALNINFIKIYYPLYFSTSVMIITLASVRAMSTIGVTVQVHHKSSASSEARLSVDLISC